MSNNRPKHFQAVRLAGVLSACVKLKKNRNGITILFSFSAFFLSLNFRNVSSHPDPLIFLN